MTTTLGVRRGAVSYIIAGGLAVAGSLVLATGPSAQAAAPTVPKVWVCKYVQKPGVNEVLKGGKNPINVDWHSTDGSGPTIGARFKDGQILSVVVAIGDNKTDANIDCAAVTPPPSTPPVTTSTSTTSTTTTSTTSTTTTSTTPPPTTSTTTMSTTTTPVTTAPSSTPASTTPAGGVGGGVTPGVGAPSTGGAGDPNPVNGFVGSGLLLAAAGVLGTEALRRRRSTQA